MLDWGSNSKRPYLISYKELSITFDINSLNRAPINWRPVFITLVLLFLLGASLFFPKATLAAEKTYQSPKKFLETAFAGAVPKPEVLWLDRKLRSDIKKITGDRYPGVRIRFWKKNKRTVWILEKIGKYEPITAGVIINDRRIEQLKVLVYRESHGWEVRYPFFTNQFKDIRLTPNQGLSQGIDGISGATLSVNALTLIATLALYLHDQTIALE